ncbi:hypothetical protein M422DRAFT_46506 [Sphaerobolus stellatus SS14]|uniref:F-box domain-containing protein n=1 Tax=Sphaerobolus stellatus (strain SS14) TaxID=990650 RepID=A0A0C9W2T9_SPHS4|nr:hypothetical protein M422DRAFT_46506 [Sphaerobolus stellatus SS14]
MDTNLLDRIPNELWLEIAEKLTSRASRSDILHFGRTSSILHEISNRVLYHSICWSAWPETDESSRRTQQLHTTLNQNPHLLGLIRTIEVLGSTHFDPWYPGLLPLANFAGLQVLFLRGVYFTPHLYSAIARLPSLKSLQLHICHPGAEEHQSQTILPSSSLEKLEVLSTSPAGSPSARTYLALFTRIYTFVLGGVSHDSLRAMMDFNLASTLTRIRVLISDDKACEVFQELLQIATELEEVDIRNSSIKSILISPHTIRKLHTYRGPPGIAGAFLQDRNVRTVSLICARSSTTSSRQFSEYLKMLTLSRTQITTLCVDISVTWKPEYTKFIPLYTPALCDLIIDCRFIEDLDSWAINLFQRLSHLQTFRIQTPANGQISVATTEEEEAIVEAWGYDCPTLRQVDVGGSEHTPEHTSTFVRWIRERNNLWTPYRFS